MITIYEVNNVKVNRYNKQGNRKHQKLITVIETLEPVLNSTIYRPS